VDADPLSDELLQSMQFKRHAMNFMAQLVEVIEFLGPDIEFLTEVFFDLGERHSKYGATPEMFPLVGTVLLETLEECLGSELFTSEMKSAWLEVYAAISNDMIAGLNAATQAKNSTVEKTVVIASTSNI
jgi:hemoglobin-like flavoprotein